MYINYFFYNFIMTNSDPLTLHINVLVGKNIKTKPRGLWNLQYPMI